MKRVQLFVHRHYDTIKLALLVLLVFLCAFIITAQIIENDTRSKNRTAAVAQVADAVKRETEAQTDIINRQFRAICILIIETSGQAGLNKLDDESRKRCESLESIEEEQVLEVVPLPRSRIYIPDSSSFQHSPGQPELQLDNSQPETSEPNLPTEPERSRGIVERLLAPMTNLLNGLTN